MDLNPNQSVLGADEHPSTDISNMLQPPNSPQHISTPKVVQVAPGTTRPQRRCRRSGSQIDRSKYICGWKGCSKAYGTLGHLNQHITIKNHGLRRTWPEIQLGGSPSSNIPLPSHRRPPGQVDRSKYICGWDGCRKEFDTIRGLNLHVTTQRHGPKRIWSELEESRSGIATSSSSAPTKDQPSLSETSGPVESKDLTPLAPEPPLSSTKNPQQSNTGLAPPQHHDIDSRNQFNGFGTRALNYPSQVSANDLGASGDDAGHANSNYFNEPYPGLYDHPENCRPAFDLPIPKNSTSGAAPVAWVGAQVPEGADLPYTQDSWTS
jgi:hypothetical protein